MVQAVKYLLCKRKELSLSVYNPGAEEAETGGSLELTDQPAQLRASLQNKVKRVAEEDICMHIHTCTPACMHVHTCVHPY